MVLAFAEASATFSPFLPDISTLKGAVPFFTFRSAVLPSVTSMVVLSKVNLFNTGLSLSLSQAANKNVATQKALAAMVFSKDFVSIVILFLKLFLVDFTLINTR